MQDIYTNSTYEKQEKYGWLLGTAFSLYGWSLIGLGDKFLDTGKWKEPLSDWLTHGHGASIDMLAKGDVVRRNTNKLGEKLGFKFAGATEMGKFSMRVARIGSVANLAMEATSPGYFFATNFANPAALAVGALWFGATGMIMNAAKSMRKGQTMSMGNAFTDNGETYTSRQRAVRAIAESHLQARSAIGNESQLYHHGSG